MRFGELIERCRQALTCELFLTGINIVCEDGSLHWLDMIGNSIAPIAFDPRKVILVAGRNKIVRMPGKLEFEFGNLRLRETRLGMKGSKHPVL